MCGTHSLIPFGVIQTDPLGGLGGVELRVVVGFDEVVVTQGTGCLSVGLVCQVDAGSNPAVLCSSSDLRNQVTRLYTLFILPNSHSLFVAKFKDTIVGKSKY